MNSSSARRVRAFVGSIVVIAACSGAASAKSPAAQPEIVRDIEMLRGGIWRVGPTYISGQPTEESFKRLADEGVHAVVSLRTTRELSDTSAVPFDQAEVAASLGMEHLVIGLGGASGTYSPDALQRIHEVMTRYDGRVLLQCASGGRSSMVWTALRTRYHDVPIQQALEEGQGMALWPHQIEQLLGERIEWRLTGEPLDAAPGWLVDGSWLIDNAATPHIRILDVRPSYTDYFTGHCENASHFDAHALRGPRNGLPAQFRPLEDMARIFGLAGVSTSQRVVVYAAGSDILSSTMMMYALEKLGHLNSSLLDGGLETVGDIGMMTQAYPSVEEEEFDLIENRHCAATLKDVERGLESGDVLFIDARPAEQYAGETEVWSRNGHIPGAVNVHWRRLVSDDDMHRMQPRRNIESIFAAAGATPDRDIIVYCGTGREASLLYLVLTRELRFPKVRLYEAGWTEYASVESLPVAR